MASELQAGQFSAVNGSNYAKVSESNGLALHRHPAYISNFSVGGVTRFQTSNSSSGDTVAFEVAGSGLVTFNNGINLGNTVSATATTLDGYEEGTFEVTNASDSSGVLTSETGEYTRIGNCVFIRVVIRVGTTFASNKVGGLPFGSVSDNGTSSWSPIGTALTGSATNAPILVSAKNGEANLYFHKQANTTTAHLPSTSEEYYRVTGFYYTTDAF